MKALVLLACLIAGPPLGEQEVPPGTLVELLSDAPADAAVVWDTPDELDYRTYDNERVLVFSSGCEAATIRVNCLVIQIVDNKPKVTRTRHKITVKRAGPPPNPPSVILGVDPPSIHTGQTSLLTWSAADAPDGVTINDQSVAAVGSMVVAPKVTTTYTAIARSGTVAATTQRIVTVSDLPPPPPKSSLVVIVYESSAGRVPLQVHKARADLEAKGMQVRVIDQDVTTGLGTIPKHVEQAIASAKTTGLPALVVATADKIIKSIKLPATADEIVREVTGG